MTDILLLLTDVLYHLIIMCLIGLFGLHSWSFSLSNFKKYLVL